MARKRRILKAKINRIALVPAGANKLPAIYKEDAPAKDNVEFLTLVKEASGFDEKGELLAVVYAPDAVDSDGDWADADVIKESCYEASRSGVEIDLRHGDTALSRDKAFIAESFIVQKDDSRFADFKDADGNVVDVTGGWAVVVKIDDADLRKKYREGEWGGVSMGGRAMFAPAETSEPSSEAGALLKFFKSLIGASPESHSPSIPPQDKDMPLSDEDVSKIVKALKASDIEAPKAPEPEAPKAPEAPKIEVEFEGDADNPEDVAAHIEVLKTAKLKAAVDWNDAESVMKYHKAISGEAPKAKPGRNTVEPVAKAADGEPAWGSDMAKEMAAHAFGAPRKTA